MEKGTADNLPAKSNGTPANAPVLVNGVYDWSNQVNQKLLKSTVAKGANDEEFALFRELCRATGLNPYRKEIWCIPGKEYNGNRSAPQIMTGVNGFYRIANAHPEYDGVELVYGTYVKLALVPNDSKVESIEVPEWVEARVFRKDRSRPQTFRAYWREYARDLVNVNKKFSTAKLGIWAKNPTAMLTKCAESMALRKAFPQELNGLHTEEEMQPEYSISVVEESGSDITHRLADASEQHMNELFDPDNFAGTYRHLRLKCGDNEGKFLSDKSNHLVGLRRHLNKYRGKYSMPEQKAFERYIGDLEREYAEFKAKEEAEAELIAKARRDYEASQSLDNGGTQIAISAETDNADFED